MDIEGVFRAYYHRLCHFAWQLTQDESVVEDIVQDVFVYLWDHPSSIKGGEQALQSFLYSAVRHSCYNHVRHQKVHLKYMHLSAALISEESSYLDKIIRAEAVSELVAAIEQLPQGCKEVVHLGYLEGLSNAEIAERLHISINTVKTQKQRALKTLKKLVTPEVYLLLCYILF